MSCDTSQNFFYQLRKVARCVEQSVGELQRLSENQNGASGHMGAVKKLLDIKKDVKRMKVDARGDMEKLQSTGNKHEEMLQLCHSLVDIQKKKLTDIETYLQQYGYVHKPDVTTTTNTELKEEEIKEECVTGEDESVQTPPQKEKTTVKTCKTPKLEDFGLSQMTLNALARADRCNEPVRYSSNQRKPDNMFGMTQVPGIFEHDGLFMTPSVLGGKSSLQTPNHKHISEYASPAWTPMEDQSKPDNLKCHHKDPKLNLFGQCGDDQGSPAPLRFKAPGKHEPPQDGAISLKSYTNSVSSVAINSSICKGPLNRFMPTAIEGSPIPPVFRTPGVKQIPDKSEIKQKFANFPKMQIDSVADNDNEPQPPELTISLSALSELTGIYNSSVTEPSKVNTVQTGTTSQYGGPDKEPQAPELTINFKDLKMRETVSSPMPKGFKSLAEKLGHSKNDNTTPPMPEMLSERLERKSQTSDTTPKPFYGYGSVTSLPQPPKFLGQYHFMKNSDMQENVPP